MALVLPCGPRGLILPGQTRGTQGRGVVAPRGLCARWCFDTQPESGLVRDQSGNGNDATATFDVASYITGQISIPVGAKAGAFLPGGALFESSTTYISAPVAGGAGNLPVDFPISFSVWASSGASGTSERVLCALINRDFVGEGSSCRLSKNYDGSNHTYFMEAQNNGVTNYSQRLFGNVASVVGSDVSNTHHVVGIFSGGASFTLYVDGNLITSGSTSSVGTGAPSSLTGISHAFAGAYLYTNGSHVLTTYGPNDGFIDEVSIYNCALEAGEVYDLYAAGRSGLQINRTSIDTFGLELPALIEVAVTYVGNADGVASVDGFSISVGNADGVASVLGIPVLPADTGVGNADGSADVNGVALFDTGVGFADGLASAAGMAVTGVASSGGAAMMTA